MERHREGNNLEVEERGTASCIPPACVQLPMSGGGRRRGALIEGSMLHILLNILGGRRCEAAVNSRGADGWSTGARSKFHYHEESQAREH